MGGVWHMVRDEPGPRFDASQTGAAAHQPEAGGLVGQRVVAARNRPTETHRDPITGEPGAHPIGTCLRDHQYRNPAHIK